MQEKRRRKSTYRLSERKHQFSSLLHRMIIDNNDFSLRESLNPLAEDTIFTLMTPQNRLSNETLTSLLKLVQKEVLIIGLILPQKWLKGCWQLLTGNKQANFQTKNINCSILNKNMIANTNTILLMIDQNEIISQHKPDILQKIILNLSLSLVVSNKVLQKRLTYWQGEQLLFDKHAGLMIIKDQQTFLNENFREKLQTMFWNVDSLSFSELGSKNKAVKDNYLHPQRRAYQLMNQQQDGENELKYRLNILSEMSLKRNWKISKGLLCYPFLYLLNIWLSDDSRDPRQLLENSLISYCQSLEQEFIKFIDNFKLPVDQLKFRNSIEAEKKQMLYNARKHLTMFQNIFPKFQLTSKSLEGLNIFFTEKAKSIYVVNNSVANKHNSILLEKLYDEIISKKFQKENTGKTMDELQSDFNKLLDVYGSQSFRVSSQLKTFNDFLMQKKYQYAQNLGKQLQVGKKKYSNEKQQLKDRLDIQTSVLQTLQTELKQLEQKRKRIDLQNNLLKSTISQYSKKRKGQHLTESNSGSRKKIHDRSDSKTINIQSRQVNKQATKSRCCCQIM